jgi:hypothetical protein
VELNGIAHWGVKLRDRNCSEVFTALAQDLDSRLNLTENAEEAASELYGRLKLWQEFLKAWQEGMGLEAARGLWGELYFLNGTLLPFFDLGSAVSCWTAGKAAHQDFQFSSASIEIKTTASKQPQSVRITSERQLDETGAGALFLVVLIVDDREISTGGEAKGISLPQMIGAVRHTLSASPPSLLLFNDLLLQRGWIDELAHKHESRRLSIRDELIFRIRPGFPRLVENDLPNGVGDVNYAVSLAACEPFRILRSSMLEVIASSPKNMFDSSL